MKLNCKPGDMAVIVRTGPMSRHLLGRIVKVKEITPISGKEDPAWLYEPTLHLTNGQAVFACEDRVLRPLRDQPDPDEMLRIAGLPAPRETTTT